MVRLQDATHQIKSAFYKSALGLRSSHFLIQYTLANILMGRRPPVEFRTRLPHPKKIVEDLRDLLKLDADQLARGVYSDASALEFRPLEDIRLGARAFRDLWRVRNREQNKEVLIKGVESQLPHLPRYYRQTFHYQTDGWLSHDSAELYDYQVETIFGGSAGAMRRQVLLPLQSYLKTKNLNEVRILDLAAGTGNFSFEIKSNYPNTHLTLNDLSPFYLKKAREKLQSFSRVDFVEANAEALPFPNESFDVVVNVYLFHELPRRVRSVVAKEIARVLKKGGLFIFADSIQLGDKPEFDASLEYFPVHYHEPYYLDYISQDLKEVFDEDVWTPVSRNRAFLTKILSFTKEGEKGEKGQRRTKPKKKSDAL